jgi:hypothetical protein
LVKDHNEQLEAALAQADESLRDIAERHFRAIGQAGQAITEACKAISEATVQASTDAAAVFAAFRACADELTQQTRVLMAMREGEFFGDAPPELPRQSLTPFELVLDLAEDADKPKARGHSSLVAMATRVSTPNGFLVKDKSGGAGVDVSITESEVVAVADAKGFDLNSARDMIRAVGHALTAKWAQRKAAEREAAEQAARTVGEAARGEHEAAQRIAAE